MHSTHACTRHAFTLMLALTLSPSPGAFQKVVDFLKEKLDFGPHSSFLDIGAGLGMDNFPLLAFLHYLYCWPQH
jgi:hypothetical protein